MNKVITMKQFGKWQFGRSVNQFFQYAFLTGYAQQYDAELQLPPWVGAHLFETTTPTVTTLLPPWKEPGNGSRQPEPPRGSELVNHDFQGYAQYHTLYHTRNRERIRGLFQPVGSIIARVGPAVTKLRSQGKTIVGVHLRRGDYGRRIFPIIPVSWYLHWLRDNWKRFANPALFIATEDQLLVEEFAQYNPQTVEMLGLTLSKEPMADCTYLEEDLAVKDNRAMDWYPDFHLLTQCDIVMGPSSTFSFFAAMMNPSLQEYWRASLEVETFQRTDPWNAYPQLRQTPKHYGHLQECWLHRNPPYW